MAVAVMALSYRGTLAPGRRCPWRRGAGLSVGPLLAGAELYGITGAILSLPVAPAVAVLLAEVGRARGQGEPRLSSGAAAEGRV